MTAGRGTAATGSTRWWWVRHAPVPNREGRIFGQMDVDADTSDSTRLRALAAALPGSAVWFVSPLRRARQTARAIRAAGQDSLGRLAPDSLSEPTFETDLAEQNYGVWQGLTGAEIAVACGLDGGAPWQRLALMTPPQGESFADLMERAEGAIRRITRRHSGCDIIAVAHAGTIRAAVGLALGVGPEAALSFCIDPLSLTRLVHDPSAKSAIARGKWEWRVGPVGQLPTAFPLS